jgi:hypothetical protein
MPFAHAADPAIRWIVGEKAVSGRGASASQMGRFETKWLAVGKNLSALADLSGRWIDNVHGRRPPSGVVLDMDSSCPAPQVALGSTGPSRARRICSIVIMSAFYHR